MRILLLFAESTYKARSFLQAASDLGLEVSVATPRPQTLQALNPAGHLSLSFTDIDASLRTLSQAQARHPFDAILAADDEGSYLAAMAAHHLGLRGNAPEAVATAQDKYASRRALEGRLASPRFKAFSLSTPPEAIAAGCPYPCVLKPLGFSASRGVMRANDRQEFLEAHRRLGRILRARTAPEASTQRTASSARIDYLVESYIEGDEYAVEGLLEAGELRVLAIFDKPDPLVGPFFEETIYVTPARIEAERRRLIHDTVQTAVETLGLSHGPIHAEVRCRGHEVFFLELAPRSIGGLCADALRFEPGGVSLAQLILRQAVDLPTAHLRREKPASGVMMIPIPRAGVLRQVGGMPQARKVCNIEDIRVTIPPGERVEPAPEGRRYLGFIFARASTADEVENALRQCHAALDVDIGPGKNGPDNRLGSRSGREDEQP